MKFIHIADVNLGAQPDRGRIWSDVRAKEIYSTFHRVIEVCEEQKIELREICFTQSRRNRI